MRGRMPRSGGLLKGAEVCAGQVEFVLAEDTDAIAGEQCGRDAEAGDRRAREGTVVDTMASAGRAALFEDCQPYSIVRGRLQGERCAAQKVLSQVGPLSRDHPGGTVENSLTARGAGNDLGRRGECRGRAGQQDLGRWPGDRQATGYLGAEPDNPTL